MTTDLRDKTILITGGLGAIAEHVLKAVTEAGARLVVTDRQEPKRAREVLADWGLAGACYLQMDVTHPDTVNRQVAEAFAAHPEINIALGHAGGTGIEPFESSDDAAFDRIVRFNFLAQTYFARAVLGEWRKRNCAGHLIFTSSYVSRIPMAGISAYTASKPCPDNASRALRVAVGNKPFTAHAIDPFEPFYGGRLLKLLVRS